MSRCKPSLAMEGQEQSSFMTLPAEIRLMILREVLSRKVPLFGRETYMMPDRKQQSTTTVKAKKEATRKPLPRSAKPERRNPPQPIVENYYKPVRGYGLSPAVLAACQSLLHQGWPILYGENTLTIDFRPHEIKPHIYVSAIFNTLVARVRDRLRLVSDTRRFASKFKHFELKLVAHNLHSTQLLRDFLRVMQPVLSLPSVHLSASFASVPNVGFHPHNPKALQLLRCKSLTIDGISQGLSDEVCKVVTGKSKILDLSQAEKKLKPVQKFLTSNSSPLARTLARVQFALLHDSVYDFDVNEFEQIRAGILALYEEVMADMKNRLFENDTWKH
ncbi:hypothetical protein LTR70_000401 [Exophiala xenobiotica]|uniref:Uncharacterized protein n=1 Tax=Lithohypha guttulata TaxID=1690604 RepID=A0ABR0KQT3_9EURO|nr:hypothetical protein LTR24_000102 [Lithohypha guttulata]KAK5330571.1 hypothetical protein LTR70_000401 [Exophiala xenobiotica]